MSNNKDLNELLKQNFNNYKEEKKNKILIAKHGCFYKSFYKIIFQLNLDEFLRSNFKFPPEVSTWSRSFRF